MYVPDNYDAYSEHESMMEVAYKKWHDRLPTCSKCNKKIEDEDLFDIDDELYCESCIGKCKKLTENYMKE